MLHLHLYGFGVESAFQSQTAVAANRAHRDGNTTICPLNCLQFMHRDNTALSGAGDRPRLTGTKTISFRFKETEKRKERGHIHVGFWKPSLKVEYLINTKQSFECNACVYKDVLSFTFKNSPDCSLGVWFI